MSGSDCICKGNWRTIIAEMEPLFGRKYIDRAGYVWKLGGVLHADDDYYYFVTNYGGFRLLTCVGSMEQQGYTLLSEDYP